MERDIDYAAVAVKNAIFEKFGRQADLEGLSVTAGDRTIEVRHGDRAVADTRDELLATIRRAASYEELWR